MLVTRSALADDIIGTASVIDGDTIEIHGVRIRLHSIDAPESDQLCEHADGSKWRCGQRAAFALSNLIGWSVVRCDQRGHDRYRRIIAVCFKGDMGLNLWLFEQGWAVAYRKYSLDHVAAEDEGRTNGRSIWEGRFDMPWDWKAA